MKLRDYQQDAVQSFFNYFDNGNSGNPLLILGTGAGKSICISELVKKIITMYPNQRIVMATHVSDLILGNYEKMIKQWPEAPVGIYSTGLGKKQPWESIVYGGIQSMYKKVNQIGFRDILIIDEIHLLSEKGDGMYRLFIEGLKKINPYLKIVGFTATAWRTKGGHLLDQKNAILTDVICDVGLGYLTRRGYLKPLISKPSLIQADLSNVKTIAGEFNIAQAESAIDKEELTKAAIDEVEKLAKDRKHFLFFCQGVQHSSHVKQELNLRGWDADIITGETPQIERTAMLEKFRTSKTKYALVNNAVLTTGTDLPNVDCIVLLRATKASLLYIQILGRGTRPIYKDGFDLQTDSGRLASIAASSIPNALVLDYAGNIERFGAVDLIEAPRRKKDKEDKTPQSPPQKICPNCREPIAIGKMECFCGYIFEPLEKPFHDETASNMAIMSHEIIAERFIINKVVYKIHAGPSGKPTLRVQYYDLFGLIASEYMCFSHIGTARDRAVSWAFNRGVSFKDMPKDTQAAFDMKELFKIPNAIYAKKSGTFMNIEGYDFEDNKI